MSKKNVDHFIPPKNKYTFSNAKFADAFLSGIDHIFYDHILSNKFKNKVKCLVPLESSDRTIKK